MIDNNQIGTHRDPENPDSENIYVDSFAVESTGQSIPSETLYEVLNDQSANFHRIQNHVDKCIPVELLGTDESGINQTIKFWKNEAQTRVSDMIAMMTMKEDANYTLPEDHEIIAANSKSPVAIYHRLMDKALVLSKNGQSEEAIRTYNSLIKTLQEMKAPAKRLAPVLKLIVLEFWKGDEPSKIKALKLYAKNAYLLDPLDPIFTRFKSYIKDNPEGFPQIRSKAPKKKQLRKKNNRAKPEEPTEESSFREKILNKLSFLSPAGSEA